MPEVDDDVVLLELFATVRGLVHRDLSSRLRDAMLDLLWALAHHVPEPDDGSL